MASSVFSGCDFVAGWASGICGLLVGHPLDTIKVWKQTIPEKTSTTSVVLTLFKHEGIKGFYKGMMFPLIAAGGLNSLFFGVYGNTMRVLQEARGVEQATCWSGDVPYEAWHWDVFYSGCAGGLAAVFVSCPVELVKTQMQTQTREPNLVAKRLHHYKGPWDCLLDQFQSKGIRGFYRGIIPLLWRDVPTYGLYILTYEQFMCLHGQQRSKTEQMPDIANQILGGALAGFVSWAAVVPLDVIKSRVQADSKTQPKYKGMIDCAVKSYYADGLQVFFRGFWVIVLRSLPVNAVTFVGYELFISFCK